MRETSPRGTVSLSTFRFPHQVICYYNKNARNNSIINKNASNRSIVLGKNNSKSRDSITIRESINVREASNSRDEATATQTF
jgi:hypothetical protein